MSWQLSSLIFLDAKIDVHVSEKSMHVCERRTGMQNRQILSMNIPKWHAKVLLSETYVRRHYSIECRIVHQGGLLKGVMHL